MGIGTSKVFKFLGMHSIGPNLENTPIFFVLLKVASITRSFHLWY